MNRFFHLPHKVQAINTQTILAFFLLAVTAVHCNKKPKEAAAERLSIINLPGSAAIDGTTYAGINTMGFIGAGWEFRTDAGFLFRLAPYLLLSNAPTPWGGVTIGWAL